MNLFPVCGGGRGFSWKWTGVAEVDGESNFLLQGSPIRANDSGRRWS